MPGFNALFNFKATTILKAFILNALICGLYVGISIHIRHQIDVFSYTKGLSDISKTGINIITTFIV